MHAAILYVYCSECLKLISIWFAMMCDCNWSLCLLEFVQVNTIHVYIGLSNTFSACSFMNLSYLYWLKITLFHRYMFLYINMHCICSKVLYMLGLVNFKLSDTFSLWNNQFAHVNSYFIIWLKNFKNYQSNKTNETKDFQKLSK